MILIKTKVITDKANNLRVIKYPSLTCAQSLAGRLEAEGFMKSYNKIRITIFLIFSCFILAAQDKDLIIIEIDKKILIESDKKTHPVFERVLPGVEIFFETYETKHSRLPEYGLGIYLNKKLYYDWQINNLVNQLKSKENFDIEDLIKTHIYLTHAAIVGIGIRWDSLNIDKIIVIKETNYSSIDSALYNYKATFDFGFYKNKAYIYFIEDKEIIRIEGLYKTGKTGGKTTLKFSNVNNTKSNVEIIAEAFKLHNYNGRYH